MAKWRHARFFPGLSESKDAYSPTSIFLFGFEHRGLSGINVTVPSITFYHSKIKPMLASPVHPPHRFLLLSFLVGQAKWAAHANIIPWPRLRQFHPSHPSHPVSPAPFRKTCCFVLVGASRPRHQSIWNYLRTWNIHRLSTLPPEQRWKVG